MLIDTYIPSNNNISSNPDGIMKYYDTSRDMSLSVHRNTICFGINHSNITGNRYMALASNITSSNSSYVAFRDGIITALSIKCKGITNSQFKIFAGGVEIYSTNLLNESIKVIDDLTVNFFANDIIQCMAISSSGVNYPVVMIEMAWVY